MEDINTRKLGRDDFVQAEASYLPPRLKITEHRVSSTDMVRSYFRSYNCLLTASLRLREGRV